MLFVKVICTYLNTNNDNIETIDFDLTSESSAISQFNSLFPNFKLIKTKGIQPLNVEQGQIKSPIRITEHNKHIWSTLH